MTSRMQLPPLPNINPSTGSAATAAAASMRTTATMTRPSDQEGLRCPRCDSPNTKFCYYNNYSPAQPRHFCKACRRYWTKGGAIRNVPIGGGCRKSKKSKSSSSSSPAAASSSSLIPPPPQLDGPLSAFHIGTFNIPYSYHPIAPNYDDMLKAVAGTGSGSHHHLHQCSIASSSSSIELTLSSINYQDLQYWELQQERVQAMLVAGGDQSQSKLAAASPLSHAENHVIDDISFGQVASDHGAAATTTKAWFLQNPYSMPNVSSATTNHNSSVTVTTNINNVNANANDCIGIPTWSDIHQFNAFP